MFKSYPDIQYDEPTRRLNRRIKIGTAILGVALIAAAAYGMSKVDTTVGPNVLNDTQGTVSCVNLTSDDARVFAGYLKAGEQRRIVRHTACSVFSKEGDYTGCLLIQSDTDKDQEIKASGANRRVKADFCAYPR